MAEGDEDGRERAPAAMSGCHSTTEAKGFTCNQKPGRKKGFNSSKLPPELIFSSPNPWEVPAH